MCACLRACEGENVCAGIGMRGKPASAVRRCWKLGQVWQSEAADESEGVREASSPHAVEQSESCSLSLQRTEMARHACVPSAPRQKTKAGRSHASVCFQCVPASFPQSSQWFVTDPPASLRLLCCSMTSRRSLDVQELHLHAASR